MNKYKTGFFILFLILISIACKNSANQNHKPSLDSISKGSYAYDFDFLKKHTKKVIELTDEEENAKILLSADYQGREMTSTEKGDSGTSYGWINYDLISSGKKRKQFNPIGGEERFWIGPE